MIFMILIKYAAFGFLGGGILILLAKGIMAHLMQRNEDYYERCCGSGGGGCSGAGGDERSGGCNDSGNAGCNDTGTQGGGTDA